jgi:S-DNA-T family DNA segregation ATPase FtsK/SpoIIIE
MDVVIRTPHGEAEITIARAGEAAAIADIVERVTGSASPPTADVDGRAILTTATIDGSGVFTGSVIDLGPSTRAAPPDAVLELVQVAGWGAGARQALGPGTYRVGPGRRINATDLDLAHVDKIAFEISIDTEAEAMVTVGDEEVRIDGVVIEGSAAWAGGILDVAGRTFELDRSVGRGDPRTQASAGEPSGTVVFNRPPRPARAPPPPPLAVPDRLVAAAEPGRPPRQTRRRHDGAPSLDQRSQVAFRAEIAMRRGAERGRRHDLFPHIARAVHLAGTTSPRLWSTRPDDDEAFEFAIGLGDIEWQPELVFAGSPTAAPDSIVAELGPLAMVPVTIDLRDERGTAFVGSSEFTRAAVRGLLVEACVQHGPADLDLVVLTDPDRAPVWEWVKWLPHSRTSGVAQVLVALDEIDGWAASTRERRQVGPGLTHMTLAVVDQAAWWRDRGAPLRPVMNDRSRPVRFVVLADSANDVPTLCTTVVTEQPGDLARVERLGQRTVVDNVQLFLIATAVAAATARRLAPLDDPELAVPAASTLPVSVPIPQLLGAANLAAATIAARWRTTNERSDARVPIGVTHRGTVDIDLERDGPHVLIGGTEGAGKSELLRSLVTGLAAGLPPDAITFALLDFAGRSSFGPCAELPHVVMHHDTPDVHLAERALRCLRAELLGRDERVWRGFTLPRFIIVVDEPAAIAIGHPQLVSSVLEIATDGQRLGVHLIVATERPSRVLESANAPTIGVRIALHMSNERESEALIGSRNATRVPRRIPGRGLVRVRDAELVEFQAAVVSASSSSDDGHDLELRPYVVGRELTPMEMRVVRESNGNAREAGPGSTARNDLSRLVGEITAAAAAVGQVRSRQLCPDPLPDVLDRRRLASERPGGGVPFALVDLPDQLRQRIRWWEPGEYGSLLIYGDERAGTAGVLASLAIGGSERYTADDLHLYVIDAGGLAPLSALSHTGAVVRHDEVNRIAQLVDLVGEQLDGRMAAVDSGRRGTISSDRGAVLPHLVVMLDDVGALRQHLDDRAKDERAKDDRWTPDDVFAGIGRIIRDGPAVGISTVATAMRERDVPADWAAHIPSRLVMQLAEPSAYASFGFRPIDLPRFVAGRALDPADRVELQIADPPPKLAEAIAALTAEPAGVRPPVHLEERSP